MATAAGTTAILDALTHRKAIFKFLSANDVMKTGSHQSGFYLPTGAWRIFSERPNEKGVNFEHSVQIIWSNGSRTDSRIKWYGAAKSEFRLTRFGPDFEYFRDAFLGSLLVLVPRSYNEFLGHVLSADEDVEEFLAAVGCGPIATWGSYEADADPTPPKPESIEECLDRRFEPWIAALDEFPDGETVMARALTSLQDCNRMLSGSTPDDRLMQGVRAEYMLFKRIEEKVSAREISRTFKTVDDFLKTARTIQNRRMARAGRSLELHVAHILKTYLIPFSPQPAVRGRPDMLIPSEAEYTSGSRDRVVALGIKTTCKDRWRQVLDEAPGVGQKFLLTLQQGISASQLDLMKSHALRLVVPAELHDRYPDSHRAEILTVDGFIQHVRETIRH